MHKHALAFFCHFVDITKNVLKVLFRVGGGGGGGRQLGGVGDILPSPPSPLCINGTLTKPLIQKSLTNIALLNQITKQ